MTTFKKQQKQLLNFRESLPFGLLSLFLVKKNRKWNLENGKKKIENEKIEIRKLKLEIRDWKTDRSGN